MEKKYEKLLPRDEHIFWSYFQETGNHEVAAIMVAANLLYAGLQDIAEAIDRLKPEEKKKSRKKVSDEDSN